MTIKILQLPGKPADFKHCCYRLICVLLLLTLLAGCMGPPSGRKKRRLPAAQGIETFVATHFDADGVCQPEVQVSVPFSRLVFKRVDQGYASAITVLVVALRDNKRVGGGVGDVSIVVDQFQETRTTSPLMCQVPVQVRGDGPVDLEVTVEVKDTSRYWQEYLEYSPRAAGAMPLYFSSFRWNLAADSVSGSYLGIDSDRLQVDITLQLRPGGVQWPQDSVALVGRISSKNLEQDLVQRYPLEPSDLVSGGLPMQIEWLARRLPFGQVQLSIDLEIGAAQEKQTMPCGPPRMFVNLQLPWWDNKQWRLHCEWLDRYLESHQIKQISSVGVDRRQAVWADLWQRLAQDSDVPANVLQLEHLQRIIEADQRFSTYSRGATSDRGRIFVRHGEPDRIEHFGDEFTREAHWEIWYFHELGMRFTFYDSHGLGDFRLHETSGY